jgi:2-keto-3-deoxy-L-rhamnonate aldolase RhmA
MRRNRLRDLLRAGSPSIGTHLQSTWPTMVEVVGHTSRFDYIEFSAEYAPFDLYTLEDFCRAAELHGMGTMIKLDQEPRKFLAQRSIGAGFQSVLFADVHTVEEARECVRATRPDTPGSGGTYGAADRRNSYWAEGGSQAFVDALNDVVLVLMIEKAEAVEQLDDILALPGIDMIQWGPSDFAMSSGRPGGWNHPETKRIERDVLERSIRAGIPPRAEITDPEEARPYLEMGVRHFCIGTDVHIVYDWLKDRGGALAEIVGRAGD